MLFLVSCAAFSQEDAWVYFNDKPNSQTFLNNPLTMLTQRALDRRTNQGIALNVNDTPIHQPYIDQIIAANGIEVKAKSKWLNCLHIRGSIANIQALTSLPFVNHVHFANETLNLKTTNASQINPIHKTLDTQIVFPYGNSANQIQMLNGHLLHQQNFTGSGKIIAVLDSGFINVNTAQPFQRLFTNNLILGGYNFVNKTTNVYDLHNHGTLVLSCMGGYKINELVGTAPDAQYYLFVTEDVASENPVEESNWVEAAEEADRLGVDIISSSLGYFAYDNPAYSHTYSDMTGNSTFASQGVNIAFSKGIIVVVSAGNSGATAEPHIGVPAEATFALAVGAVTPTETYASFSSIGPSFDGRIKPDVMAQGQNAVLSNTDGAIVTASGTSFSGPIMAGMIASFWQAYPTLTNQEVVNIVKQSSSRFTNPDAQFGYGIPDFQLALNTADASDNAIVNESFIVYPNPLMDYIKIKFPTDLSKAHLTLYNNLGQMVFEKKEVQSAERISLEQLNSGIYFFKITSAKGNQAGKIVKR